MFPRTFPNGLMNKQKVTEHLTVRIDIRIQACELFNDHGNGKQADQS